MMKTRGKILWVDDEIDHLKPHILFLQEKGFAIVTASSGGDGIELARTQDIDIALIDQYMPGIDGIDTLRELKKNDPNIEYLSVGGSNLKNLGIESIFDLKDITYLGFTSVLLNIFKIKNRINK